MKSTMLRIAATFAIPFSVLLFPLSALGQAVLAPEVTRCEVNDGNAPASKNLATRDGVPNVMISNTDMLHRGVLGRLLNPRAVPASCQYGVFCPSTYCTSLRTQCQNQGGKYTETFIGKCCASPDSSYARFVCVVNGQTVIDQYCRY